MEGLRERKKRQTREAIAAAAMALFVARGFDAVTVAEVARAADVSEKTVFNYFPAKEDLVFARRRGAPRRAHRGDPRRGRRARRSSSLFRAATLEFLERVEHDPVESIVAIPRLVAQQPRAARPAVPRLGAGGGRARARGRRGDGRGRGRPRAARSSRARWRGRTASSSAPPSRACSPARTSASVAADLREQAHRAYETLEEGLAGYGVKAS